jgi:hypothetical protein
MPTIAFTDPQMASVGSTKAAARGRAYRSRLDYRPRPGATRGNGRADGIFRANPMTACLPEILENQPIDADSCWNQQIRKSSKFPFEIKSANF